VTEPRRATVDDAAAIAALTRAAYEKWIPVIGRAPKPMTADYHVAVREHRIDVLEENGGIVALVEMIPADDHLLIENLAVAPTAQGRGLGARLLQRVEEVARDLGLAEIRLYTNARFVANVAYYRKRGYRCDGETAYLGGFITHMSKRI
jgi:N-acetylglutamate synthase-like GNAT family acetyltransferase